MSTLESSTKKSVNLSLNEALVKETRSYCDNLSAKVEEMLLDFVRQERQSRQSHRDQAQRVVHDWNRLHDAAGSFADEHSTL
ncbi:MAG: hypothetical protein RL111_1899 [Pseudomonadota bacterium]|jgi:post-segregation antitoxin (ccd killing protein)